MSFQELNTIEEREVVPGFRGRFVHSDNMTLAFWDVDSGSELPEHSHPHEQICNVLEGQFELTVNGESRVLEPGTVAVIPSHVTHSGKAITPCKILDAFTPSRDDYR